MEKEIEVKNWEKLPIARKLCVYDSRLFTIF